MLEEKRHEALEVAQEAYGLGLEYFDQHQFSLSADEFVKVVRPFLSKPAMKNPYVDVQDFKVQILDAMHHLGLIYFKDAESHYADSYSKAAAIFQYCHGFAQKYEIDTGIDYLRKSYMAEAKFLNHLGLHDFKDKKEADAYHASKVKEYAKYKAELGDIREAVGQESKDVFVDNEISTITTSVSILSGVSRDFFVSDGGKSLVQILIKNCQELLGVEPCRFSIVGLGSLAGGKMTLWSDLEFVILTENDDPKVREYFKNLTKLLHIKVVNFGETSLRSVGIEHLNNFKTGEAQDEWFWDEIITSGFSFDGPHWHACKLPLGRQGGYRIKKKVKDEETGTEREEVEVKPDFELILTPKQMAELQLGNSSSGAAWFESDKHLLQGLLHVSLIYGTQGLLDDYRAIMKEMHTQHRELFQKRALQILSEDIDNFELKLAMEEEGNLMDVKKSIYRVSDRIIDALANYFGIVAAPGEVGINSWEMIDRMAHKGDISTEGANHLKEALSVAVGLRLATYSHNRGQVEGISTYVPAVEHLTEEKRKELIEQTFHLRDTTPLYHFYYVIMRVQKVAKSLCAGSSELQANAEMMLQTDTLIDTSYHTKGLVHARFLEYQMAIECMEMAKNLDGSNLEVIGTLYLLYRSSGVLEKAISTAKEQLNFSTQLPNDITGQLQLAYSYSCLATVYLDNGEYDAAIENYAKALEKYKIGYSDNPFKFHVALCCANVAGAYFGQGEVESAIDYYMQALEIHARLPRANYLFIIACYSNLATIYKNKGEIDRGIKYLTKAVEIYSGDLENPNHPCIAVCHTNFGNLYLKIGNTDLAIKYSLQALKVLEVIYSDNPSHPHFYFSYTVLGEAHTTRGEIDSALEYHTKALKVLVACYSHNSNHPKFIDTYFFLGKLSESQGKLKLANEYYTKATSVNIKGRVVDAQIESHLGLSLVKLGEFDRAIEYLTIALDALEIKYSSNINHPEIAALHSSLGMAYEGKSQFALALEHHIRAQRMCELVYSGDLKNHPELAKCYANLASIFRDQGKPDKAIEYNNLALNIFKIAYSGNNFHPDIASCYGNLGSAYRDRGEYERAIQYTLKALEIFKVAYHGDIIHQSIGMLYNNLGLQYKDKGDLYNALSSQKKALEIRLSLYQDSPNHPEIGASYSNLGSIYRDQREYDKAVEHYQIAMKIFEVAYSDNPNHFHISANYNSLGIAYMKKGEVDRCIMYLTKALEIRLLVYQDSQNHPEIASSYLNLGTAHIEKRDYFSGIDFLNKALSIFLEVFLTSPNHPYLINCYQNLIIAYERVADHHKAIECIKEIHARHLAVYGDGHPSVIDASMQLQKAYLARESKSKIAENIYQVDAITSSLQYKVKFVFKGSIEHMKLSQLKDPSLVDLSPDIVKPEELTRNLTFVIPEGYGFGGLCIRGKEVNASCSYKPVQKITVGKLDDKSYIMVNREGEIEQKGIILEKAGQKSFGGDVPVAKALALYNEKHPESRIEFGMVRSFEAQQFIEEVTKKPISAWPDHFDVACKMKLAGDQLVEFD